MAQKKKAPAKKKSTPKKKKPDGSSSKIGYIILLLIIVGGLVVYGLYQTQQFAEGSTITKTSSKKEGIKNNSSSSSGNSQKKETTKKRKFDKQDIKAKDELVESSSTNENLPDYSSTDAYYYTNSFDFGWPEYNRSEAIVEHQHYAFSYNEKTEQPNWVAYTLTKKNLDNAQYKRKDDFRSDPDVSTESASVNDYKKSGYDRGHLAPAADFTWDKDALSESFFMSNMSPQEPSFNRGIWKKLEEQVRNWARANHKIYVVTGPITKGISKKIGANKVAVPSHYYKVILDIQEPQIKAIGFVLKNKKSSDEIMSFAISVDEVEKQTGLDFFPGIPDDLEDQVESTLDKTLWK